MQRSSMRKECRKKMNRKHRKKIIITLILCILLLIVGKNIYSLLEKDNATKNDSITIKDNPIKKEEVEVNKEIEKEQSIVISAAGDCTLGTDTKFNYYGSFPHAVEQYGYDYSQFMKNVYSIFSSDDYTIVNLETTLTDYDIKANKEGSIVYNFKGNKEYVKILSSGSIEGVTIANNHTYDYGQIGIEDTMNVLKENNIGFCGYSHKIIKDIKGIKVGFLGYTMWWISDELKEDIKNDISELKNNGCKIVIPYFHWGEENSNYPTENQKIIAKYAIDSGADMVLGSHSHVIQSLESYKGKLIAYSLGNFCFGGNSNPNDKTTFILQATFNMKNNEIASIGYKVIPTFISSVMEKNDYIPTIAYGEKAEEILRKINELSPTLGGKINNNNFSI